MNTVMLINSVAACPGRDDYIHIYVYIYTIYIYIYYIVLYYIAGAASGHAVSKSVALNT